MFGHLIRGQNEQVNVAAGEGLPRAKSCRWCRMAEAGENVVYREAAFVVLEGPWRRRGGYVTVVTTAHASNLTELPSWQMGAVLAGLTKASERPERCLRRSLRAGACSSHGRPWRSRAPAFPADAGLAGRSESGLSSL